MGSEFEVVAWGADRSDLLAAANEALDEIERLDQQLSHYRSTSDICHLNERAARGPVYVEPRLFDLLRRVKEIHARTGGAFDVTAGPLIRAWGFFLKQGRVPAPEDLEAALKHVGMDCVELDERASTVRFLRPGVELHLGAVGKGYAVDRAVEVLAERGVPGALVHGGNSSIGAFGVGPGGQPWGVGLRHPLDAGRRLAVLCLENCSLSTSGATGDFFEVEGRRYCHVLDPRRGRPAEGLLSVSVIAPTATESDALSTAFFVMGPELTRAYCAERPEIAALLVPDPGDRNAELELLRVGIDFQDGVME